MEGRGAADVVERAVRLYGVDPGAARGIVHVVATWAEAGGGLVVMKIGADTPKSGHDFFALNLARARSASIVVTGRILREEPALRYDLLGPGTLPEALHAYRREIVGLADPPLLLVITSGRDLPVAHPVWSSWARPLVFTRDDAAEALRRELPDHVEVVGHASPSITAAVEHLRGRGVESVLIEAGPSTALALYRPPAVDELLLSIFRGPTIPAHVRGGSFLSEAELHAAFADASKPARVEEPSGPWTFHRLLRRGIISG